MFSKILPGKSVLFIPVYSMRSHVTGLYNLKADGNFNRVMSVIRKHKPAHAIVTIPTPDRINPNFNVNDYKIDGVDLVFCNIYLYKDNADATRRASLTVCPIDGIGRFDAIISEPQVATIDLIDSGITNNLYYWCVATSTDDWPVWFVDEFKDVDVFIADHVKTIVATEAQKKKLGRNAVVDDFYIPQQKKKTIYFPFRISDPNYEYDMLMVIMNHIRARGYADRFSLLIADVNESSYNVPAYAKLVPTDHDVYSAIIAGKSIIPYFEHMDRLPHISIYEMIDAGCKIVTWDCADARKYDTITTVSSYQGFEDAIVKLIEEEA